MRLHQGILTSSLVLGLALTATSTASAQPGPQPVIINNFDLQELSPRARREVEELLARKRAAPTQENARIRVGRRGDIFDGDIGRDGVDIRLLGGSIRIGGKNRPRPQQLALYEEAVEQVPGDYRVGMIATTLFESPDSKVGVGVYVEGVEPNSPAAAAGLQKGDVITSAGEEPVTSVEQLFDLTEQTAGQPMVLGVSRENENFTARLTPEFVGPAIPDDLTITLTKSGNRPLHIHVAKGGIEFEIEGEQLDQLVAKYKPYIVQMLKKGLSEAQSGEVPTPGADPTSNPSIDLGTPAPALGEPGPSLGVPQDSLDDVVPEAPKD